MKLYKKIPLEHAGKQYEIRILYEDNRINIVSFLDNRPANGFRYQIQVPKNAEIQKLLKHGDFSHLIDNAREDIKKDRVNRVQQLL
jgi:hypothetical protein